MLMRQKRGDGREKVIAPKM